MYKAGQRQENKRKKRIFWIFFFIIFIALVIAGVFYVLNMLKPETSIKESAPIVRKLDYEDKNKMKKYAEDNFTIELPSTWKQEPRPKGMYKSYTWTNINKSANGESIVIYEDKIPLNYAVNRVVIVEPEGDHVAIKGDVSENCNTYTKDNPTKGTKASTPAKWQGIDFLCDQNNISRDVIGTSSEDGVNTVVLSGKGGAAAHKYFFTYTNHSINGNYTTFIAAITSFKMQ
jgi:hypothetical protein